MVEAVNNTLNGASNALYLQERLNDIKSEQGVVGKLWNGIKEATHIGISESVCESKLEEYQNGEISFDEALEYIEKYEAKQENAVDLIANVVTGTGAIALSIATCGTSVPVSAAILLGAPTGAAIKTTVKGLDRATNEVEGDVLDAKQIAKDAISGATTGATSAVMSHIGQGVDLGNFGLTIRNGVKCGLACGAASGAIGYASDVLLDEDRSFKFGELTKNTAFSALVSGTVGAVVGAGYYGVQSALGNVGSQVNLTELQRQALANAPKTSKELAKTIAVDSTNSSARKVLNNAERQIIAAA